MINSPKIINDICKKIDKLTKPQLDEAIKEVDKSIYNEDISEAMQKAEDLAKDFDGGYFNYRIVEKEYKWKNNSNLDEETIKRYKLDEPEIYYEIHEVYYNGKNEIVAWTTNPISIYFETYYDIRDTINHIKKAASTKILKLVEDENGDDSLIELDKYIKDIK